MLLLPPNVGRRIITIVAARKYTYFLKQTPIMHLDALSIVGLLFL